MKNCVILMHICTGDSFTMYACVCHYAKIYDMIYIFCMERNKEFIQQLYEKLNVNITIIPIEEHKKCKLGYAAPLSFIDKLMDVEDYNIIKTGQSFEENAVHCNEWVELNKISKYFWRNFYKQANLDYEIRYDYMDINRNLEKEKNFYDKIVEIYGKKYIFVHDHRIYSRDVKNGKFIRDLYLREDIPVFHPNINYYKEGHKFYDLWGENLISNNILDYGMIIENAFIVDIIDSSFGCYCPYLKLDNVSKKIIRTGLNIVDYHNSYKNWQISKYV